MSKSKVLRRAGAEGGVSLSKRRRWYADPPPPTPPPQGERGEGGAGDGQGGGAGEPAWFASLPKEAQDEYKRLRTQLAEVNSESAGRRHEIKKLQDQIDELRTGQQRHLEEQGQYKTLAEQRAAEIAELKARSDRADALDKMIRQSNEARIKRIPEAMRDLVPVDYSPETLAGWLDKNAERLAKAPAPNIDAGAGGSGGSQRELPKLTDDERELAKAFGMTEAEYAKGKQQKGQPVTLESLKAEAKPNG